MGCSSSDELRRSQAREAAVGTVAALVRNDSAEIEHRFGRALTDSERLQFVERLPSRFGGDPKMYAAKPTTGIDWDSPVVWLTVTQANTVPPIPAVVDVGLYWDDESDEWHAVDVVSQY